MNTKRFLWILLAALPILFALELVSGPAAIDLGAALGDWFAGRVTSGSIILAEVRFPRALLALLVGASLAISGAALQGLLRNPLASPDILGVSQAAGLCAVLALYYGFAQLAWFVLPLAALAGAVCAVLLMLQLARHVAGTHTIILAGIAISALAGAFIALALNFAPNPYALQEIFYWMLGSVANRSMQEVWLALPFIALALNFAPNPYALQEIFYWMLGSVANRSMQEVWLALPFMLLGWILLLRNRRFLDALSLGEDTAHSLGFATQPHTWQLILGVACCTGASVAVSGNIGFVGLVVPHLLRPLAAAEPGRLLWFALPGGAALLLLADVLVQVLPGGQELQLGVITAVLGGPFFLYLLLKKQHLFI